MLLVARVKKIIATDPDIANCSNNAAFVITVATEMFLQHLVSQAQNVVKSERKPRRNIQYRDVAAAVARVENLEFLADVVPKTTTLRVHRLKVGKEAGGLADGEGGVVGGQRTLDGLLGGGSTGAAGVGGGEVEGEQQATNGAASHADTMDVDVEQEEPVMHTAARTEPVPPPEAMIEEF